MNRGSGCYAVGEDLREQLAGDVADLAARIFPARLAPEAIRDHRPGHAHGEVDERFRLLGPLRVERIVREAASHTDLPPLRAAVGAMVSAPRPQRQGPKQSQTDATAGIWPRSAARGFCL